MICISLHQELTEHFYLWIGKQPQIKKEPIVMEGYYKVSNGVKHLVRRYKCVDIDLCYKDIVKEGLFSKRPYRLAQRCDGSIEHCVLSLYDDFCRHKNLNPIALLNEAYPDGGFNYCEDKFAFINKIAQWEGTRYPRKWNDKAFEGLIESLTEINYRSLRDLLTELV